MTTKLDSIQLVLQMEVRSCSGGREDSALRLSLHVLGLRGGVIGICSWVLERVSCEGQLSMCGLVGMFSALCCFRSSALLRAMRFLVAMDVGVIGCP